MGESGITIPYATRRQKRGAGAGDSDYAAFYADAGGVGAVAAGGDHCLMYGVDYGGGSAMV